MMRGKMEPFPVPTMVQADYKGTTYGISTRRTIKGVEARGTIDDISLGMTTKATKPRS
jgi:hypothetical protein